MRSFETASPSPSVAPSPVSFGVADIPTFEFQDLTGDAEPLIEGDNLDVTVSGETQLGEKQPGETQPEQPMVGNMAAAVGSELPVDVADGHGMGPFAKLILFGIVCGAILFLTKLRRSASSRMSEKSLA